MLPSLLMHRLPSFCRVEEESLNSMSLYASVVVNRIDEGMYTRDGKIFIQKNIPTQYYTRKHKHGLWPLEVLQHQVCCGALPFSSFISSLLFLDQREVSWD